MSEEEFTDIVHAYELPGDPPAKTSRTLLDTWHPINGKWVKINQLLVDGEVEFYTDGVLEDKHKADKLKGMSIPEPK